MQHQSPFKFPFTGFKKYKLDMANEILSLTISVSYVDPANISWSSSREFLIVYPYTRPLGFLFSYKELNLQSLMRCPHLSHSLFQKSYFNISYTELPFISAKGPNLSCRPSTSYRLS